MGRLAAWHFAGLVVDAAEKTDPVALVLGYRQVDPSSAEFDVIAEQWDADLKAEDS